MSHKKDIYSKTIPFALMVAVTILIGTVVTTIAPMFTKGMHPKLENLQPYTMLELAGRDIYQKEGCVNCHTQTVRPLKADVLRYGDYSKAGEFAYDRPFLWGSKRTGPDLARIGGKYPDEWHIQHMENPQAFFPKSNMPKYPWLKEKALNVNEMKARMDALGFPYTDEDVEEAAESTELDAMVAYLQIIGTAVEKEGAMVIEEDSVEDENPLAGNAAALEEGKALYSAECAGCHGVNAEGNIGASLVDYAEAEPASRDTYIVIANGYEGVMPGFASSFSKERIWALVEYIESLDN